MKTLKGKLEFISLWNPVLLSWKGGSADLRSYYFGLFKKLDGVKSSMNDGMNYIEIKSDEKSDNILVFKSELDFLSIELRTEKSMSNLAWYLSNMLQALNGRSVILTIKDDSIKIEPDPEEKVHGLYYTRGNCCAIDKDDAIKICKPSTDDCCIFLSAGACGWECMKFDTPLARMILNRYSEGEMNSTRIGNCEILGRKE